MAIPFWIIGHVHLDLLQFEKSRSFKIIGTKGVIEGSLATNKIKIFYNSRKKKVEKKLNYNFIVKFRILKFH